MLIVFEDGFFFGNEGVVGVFEVLSLYVDGLGLGFCFDGCVQVYILFGVELVFGYCIGKGWVGVDVLGLVICCLCEIFWFDECIEKVLVFVFFGIY